MSNAALARIDARLHAALERVGAADRGNYRATPEATPVSVRCYVDRGDATQGQYNQVAHAQTTLTLLRADVAQPARLALVDIDGERFQLDVLQRKDEGHTVWTVRELGAVPSE